MVKKLLPFVAVGSLGACTQDATTPLSRLGDSNIEIVANGQVNILLHVNNTGDGCPILGDDAIAKFNGTRMEVARGGYDTDANGCYPIAFWVTAPMSKLVAFEQTTTGGSQMIVQDHSATWSVGMTKLFSNDFVLDTAASTITWTNVTSISTASVVPHVPVTVTGNVIKFPKGAQIDSVDAYAHPATTACDGPAVCSVDLGGSKTFVLNP